ncbi:hypothetical protein [Cetobacterium sp.]|nr:hypothetical protein [Cetobacterium sp.]
MLIAQEKVIIRRYNRDLQSNGEIDDLYKEVYENFEDEEFKVF